MSVDASMRPTRWQRMRARMLAVATVVAWLAYAPALWWLDRHALRVAGEAYASAGTLALNALSGACVALALAALTRRLLLPLVLVAALQALVYLASATKLDVLGSPFALQDFHFLTSINRSTLELLGAYVERPLWLGGGCALVLVALGLLWWLERPWWRWRSPAQGLVVVAGVLPALTLLLAGWPWPSLYSDARVRPSQLGPTPAVLRSGLFTSLVHKHLQTHNMQFVVDDAAIAAARAILARGDAAAPSPPLSPAQAGGQAGARPDIIVILSESFMDPRRLAGMAEVADLIPNTRTLLAAGQGGDLVVPAYGGGTVRSEFEVLTGMPADAFPKAYFPYVDLELRQMPGLASVLRAQGYRTIALHGNGGAFWNRANTYAAMGFERFLTVRAFREARMQRDGLWYSDQSTTDLLLRVLDDVDGPAFVSVVTIQNHGPYSSGPEAPAVRDPARLAAIPLPPGLGEQGASELRSYLYHLQAADSELGRLKQALDARGRPYRLLFYGDHLPALPQAWEDLGFVDGNAAELQPTPWLLLGGATAGPRQLRAWQLPAELLAAAGVEPDAYLRWVLATGRRLEGTLTIRERVALQKGLYSAANARATGKEAAYAQAP